MKLSGLSLHQNSNAAERARWYIRIRWFFLLAIAIPGVLSNIVGEGFSEQVQRDSMLALVALLSNAVFFLLAAQKHKSQTFYKRLTIVLIVVDILTVTFLIFTKGGVESRSLILYTIPLLMSSAVFGQKGVYYTATLSVGLYNALILADYTNLIHSINAANPDLRTNGTYVLNTVTFFSSTLIIIALLADFITRLVTEQQKLTEENAYKLEEAQRIAKLGSWSWDLRTNNIEWSNQLFEMFKVKKSDFSGTFDEYLKLVHPKDIDLVKQQVEEAIKSTGSFSYDHRLKTDGEVSWIHADGQVIKENGKPVKMFGTAQDVTALKKAQQKLEESNKDLEELNKLMVGRELRMLEMKQELKKYTKEAA